MLPKRNEYEKKFSNTGYYIYVVVFILIGVPVLAIAGYSGFTGKGFAPHVSELFHSIAPTMELRRKGIIFCIFLPGFIISFLLASAVALLFDVFTQQGRFSD